MACKICGRGACTESFHPIEEQEMYDKYSGKDEQQYIRLLVEKDRDIIDLKNECVDKVAVKMLIEKYTAKKDVFATLGLSFSDSLIKEMEFVLSDLKKLLESEDK